MRIAVVDLAHIFRAAWHAGEAKPLNFAQEATLEKSRQIVGSGYDRIIYAIDSPPYDRAAMFPDYKGTREDPGELFRKQYVETQEKLRREGGLIWAVPGAEADDVIASVAYVSEIPGLKVPPNIDVWSRDKDLYCLIGLKGVRVLSTKTGEEVTERSLLEHEQFGVRPDQMLDFLSLVGDKADNIPGCPGCGPKTAAALLKHGSLGHVLSHPETCGARAKMAEALRENSSKILHGREIIRLRTDLELPWHELERKTPAVTKELKEDIVETAGEIVLTESETGPTAALARPDGLSVQELVSRVTKVKEVQGQLMVNDVHFGTVPTAKKATLLKPGAELLGMAFQLGAEFDVERERDGDHVDIVVTCTLFHIPTGNRVGTGMGSCSTRESKYAWRKGTRKCPKCGAETINRDNKGNGYYCWKKKGGCGAQFDNGDQSIESQSIDRVPNPDVYDLHNTVLKMAVKRAHVAAILFATCASEIFTQDIEDMAEEYYR